MSAADSGALYNVTDKQIDEIGRLANGADNLLAALKQPIMPLEGFSSGLTELRERLHALYTALAPRYFGDACATPYFPSVAELQSVGNAFTYHPPKPGQQPRYEAIRAQARALAVLLLENCPPSREQAVALTELESAVMWANAAIARNE